MSGRSASAYLVLEEWIAEDDIHSFTCRDVQDVFDLPPQRASNLIAKYVDEVDKGDLGNALYVIHRTGWGTTAVWHVGHLKGDMKSFARQTGHDFRTRILRAVLKRLDKFAVKNPRLRGDINGIMLDLGGILERVERLIEENA